MANVPEEGPNSGSSGYDSSLSCPPITSSFRVLMLGDTKVGKSSIMRRYVDDDFDFNFRSVHHISVISVFSSKVISSSCLKFFQFNYRYRLQAEDGSNSRMRLRNKVANLGYSRTGKVLSLHPSLLQPHSGST